jgi:anti-sigma regulatory factor (Ser/Thr protein kinase)
MDLEDIAEESVRGLALLVVSELMTNVIVHTNSAGLTGRLRRTNDQLLVHIHDEGDPLSVQHPHRSDYADEHGRGLVLIALSVTAIGTEREADGSRTVWARIPLTGCDS